MDLRASTRDAAVVYPYEMSTRTRNSLWAHLTGPPTPRPIGRRRTFFEWLLETGFRVCALFLSLCALAFIAITAGMLLLVLFAAVR